MKIEKILFDLDDTLIHTHSMFMKAITQVSNLISKEKGIDANEIEKYFYEEIAKTYSIAKVNPDKVWPLTFSILQKKYKLTDEEKSHHMNILLNVYNRKPKIKDYAIELLDKCEAERIELGLVTHASRKWTEYKIKSVRIKKYFKHIQVVDTNRAKNSSDWLKALEKINGTVNDTWVIGDNIKGDIQSAYKVGFRNLIWINKKDGWDLYKTGELPKGVHTAKDLHEVYNILFTS